MYDKKALRARLDSQWNTPLKGKVDWQSLEHLVLSILESTDVPLADKPALIAEAFGAHTGRGVVEVRG